MFIKICANTNLADAQLAAELGASAVGFVFAESKRQVTGEQVADMTEHLPAHVEKVGVFSTDDPYEVEHWVACCDLTVAQLHGVFDAEMVQLLSNEFGGKLKIIQTVAYEVNANDREIADKNFVTVLSAVFAEPTIWAVLIDAAKGGVSGGLGVAYDWSHVAALVKQAIGERKQKPRIIIAGGLRPENLAEAIAVFAPFGVDVASGVESSPGRKDPAKMRAFLEAAQTAFAKLEK